MSRILLINSVCGTGSTGKICGEIARRYEAEGHEVKIAYGRDGNVPDDCRKYAVRIGSGTGVKIHGVYTRVLDRHGLASAGATKKFLRWAESYDPEVLWLHNIHGYYINYELLFDWIKSRPDMEVKWTLHDCWAFTGHCAYFSFAGCEKWKTGCGNCPQKNSYPESKLADRSAKNWLQKKECFTGVKNMTLIAPSAWLAGLASESFLKEYPVEVQRNRIDRDLFRPTPGDFREKQGIGHRFMVLGVANVWEKRKGLDDLVRLSQMLDEHFVLVLVGLSDEQRKNLPENIIGLGRTDSPRQLAEIYTAADVFVNPTYEDNFPTVNLEAEACGTDVITYKACGAPETIFREKSLAVECGAENLFAALQNYKES